MAEPVLAPPKLTPRQEEERRLLAEYELPDSQFDPERDGEVLPRVKTPAPLPVSPVEKPRNPDGTFAKTEGAAPTSTSKHPAFRVRAATELGLTAAEVEEHSPEELKEVIYLRTLSRMSRREEQSDQPPRSPAPTASEPEVEPDLGLDDKGFDPDLVALIKRQDKIIREQGKRLDEVQGFQRQRMAESLDEYADRVFVALKDPALGEGTLAEIQSDPEAVFLRKMVWNLAGELANSKEPQQIIPKLREAHGKIRSRFGVGSKTDPKPTLDPKVPTEDEKEAWRAGGLGPSTSRRASELPKGDERSIRGIAQYLQEHDITDDDTASASEANLPD